MRMSMDGDSGKDSWNGTANSDAINEDGEGEDDDDDDGEDDEEDEQEEELASFLILDTKILAATLKGCCLMTGSSIGEFIEN